MEKGKKRQKQIMYVDAAVDVVGGIYMIGYRKENMGGIRIINIKDARDHRDLSDLMEDLKDPNLVKVTLGRDFLILYLGCFYDIEASREQFFDLRDYAEKLGVEEEYAETVQSLAQLLGIKQPKAATNARRELEQKVNTLMIIFKQLYEWHKGQIKTTQSS